MHLLQIIYVDDETVDYFVDHVHVITANHDDDGWVGMGRIDSAMREFARLTDVEIREE